MIVFGKERDYVIHDDKKINGFFGPYRFLSNYHEEPFWFEGRKYTTSEHAFQAAKYPPLQRHIFDNITAVKAKELGGKAPLIIDEWEKIKAKVMLCVIFDKFSQSAALTQLLIETGNRYLEESNHWGDSFWGVHYPENWKSQCPNGIGKNNLGIILTKVRTVLSSPK